MTGIGDLHRVEAVLLGDIDGDIAGEVGRRRNRVDQPDLQVPGPRIVDGDVIERGQEGDVWITLDRIFCRRRPVAGGVRILRPRRDVERHRAGRGRGVDDIGDDDVGRRHPDGVGGNALGGDIAGGIHMHFGRRRSRQKNVGVEIDGPLIKDFRRTIIVLASGVDQRAVRGRIGEAGRRRRGVGVHLERPRMDLGCRQGERFRLGEDAGLDIEIVRRVAVGGGAEPVGGRRRIGVARDRFVRRLDVEVVVGRQRRAAADIDFRVRNRRVARPRDGRMRGGIGAERARGGVGVNLEIESGDPRQHIEVATGVQIGR